MSKAYYAGLSDFKTLKYIYVALVSGHSDENTFSSGSSFSHNLNIMIDNTKFDF